MTQMNRVFERNAVVAAVLFVRGGGLLALVLCVSSAELVDVSSASSLNYIGCLVRLSSHLEDSVRRDLCLPFQLRNVNLRRKHSAGARIILTCVLSVLKSGSLRRPKKSRPPQSRSGGFIWEYLMLPLIFTGLVWWVCCGRMKSVA